MSRWLIVSVEITNYRLGDVVMSDQVQVVGEPQICRLPLMRARHEAFDSESGAASSYAT